MAPTYNLSVAGFAPGDEVVELLSCTTTTVDPTGNVTMFMGQGRPMVYMTTSGNNGSGLCPNPSVAKPLPSSSSTPKNAGSSLTLATTAVLAVALGWVTVFLA